MTGFRVSVLLTVLGTATMVGLQLAFRRFDPLWVAPIAQAVALSVVWVAAWPLWFRRQPSRRFGFFGHAAMVLVIAAVIAAVRIASRVG